MARRRSRSQETAIVQLIGLAAVGFAFSPFLRGLILWAALVVVAALIVFVIYRLTALPKPFYSDASSPMPASTGGVHLSAIAPTIAESFRRAPETTKDVRSLDWFQFEKLVAAVFEQQGYSVERSGGANPDGGIDLFVSRNGITSAVQCKHWKSWKVGVKQIREFLGALADRGVQNGIFVTLQEYTSEAKELAARHNIRLIGESELMQMLEAANWRFNPAITSVVNDTRKFCPKCESQMVLRTAKKGSSVGSQFWGCSAYPRCRFTFQQ